LAALFSAWPIPINRFSSSTQRSTGLWNPISYSPWRRKIS
jgi:hypothetical protein